jgi:hypothetical protein
VEQIGRLSSRIARCKDLADMEKILPGSISRAGGHKTQQAWWAYHAAFATLLGKLRPAHERSAWLLSLERQRVVQLQRLADGC